MARKVEYLKNGVFYNMDNEPFLNMNGEWLLEFDAKQQIVIRNAVESNFPVQAIAYKDVPAEIMEVFYNFFVEKYASLEINKSLNDYMEHALFDYWSLSHIDVSADKLLICLNFLEYDNLALKIKNIKKCPLDVLQLIPDAKQYMLSNWKYDRFIKDVNAGKSYGYLSAKVNKALTKWLKKSDS